MIWHTGYPSFTLTPVVRSTFDARQSGEVAGWVVFTLQDASGKTYEVDRQEELKKYEGKQVRIKGTLDPDGKTIHVK